VREITLGNGVTVDQIGTANECWSRWLQAPATNSNCLLPASASKRPFPTGSGLFLFVAIARMPARSPRKSIVSAPSWGLGRQDDLVDKRANDLGGFGSRLVAIQSLVQIRKPRAIDRRNSYRPQSSPALSHGAGTAGADPRSRGSIARSCGGSAAARTARIAQIRAFGGHGAISFPMACIGSTRRRESGKRTKPFAS
jgi:hypothetical protein